MKRLFITILMILLAAAWAPAASAQQLPGQGQEAGAGVARRVTRPGIYLTPKRLERLYELAASGTFYWQRLRRWGKKIARQDADPQEGPGLALDWLVSKKVEPEAAPRLKKLAVACATRVLKPLSGQDLLETSAQVCQVALTLDWAWDAFTPSQRKELGAWLVRTAKKYENAGRGCFDTASVAALRMTLMAGLAARGLDPGAEDLINQALVSRYEREILPCLNNLGHGGAWFEGDIAGARAGMELAGFAAALKTALGRDISQDSPWFAQRLKYCIFNLMPGIKLSPMGPYREVGPGGDEVADPVDAADDMRLQMLMLIFLQPESQAAGYARSLLFDLRAPGVVADYRTGYEFIWLEPNGQVVPLATAPLSLLAPDAGRAFSRSDWSELATWLKFTSGPHFAANQHLDAGSLTIYKGRTMMRPGGGYDGPLTPHRLNYAMRTIAQNSVVIYDPREYSWYDLGAGKKPKGTYANDGGQKALALFDKDHKVTKSAPWTASGWETGGASFVQLESIYRRARIVGHASRPRFEHFMADMTPAYQGDTDKAARVVRHVFHLRSNGPQDAQAAELVLVVDDVTLTHDQSRVSWVGHFPIKPRAGFSLKELGPGRLQGRGSKITLKWEHEGLQVVNLVPGETDVKIIGGPGQADSWVAGRNYPPRRPVHNRAPWRVEFDAGSGVRTLRPMVTALIPLSDGSPPLPRLERLKVQSDRVVGVVVHDPAWPRLVVVHLGDPNKDTMVSYKYPEKHSRHLVAGLLPGHRYVVEVKGGMVSVRPSSALEGIKCSPAGSLSFLVVPGEPPRKQ